MRLVGMLDSPYVRRVAVSLQLLGLRFEHQSLSVFRTYEQFRQINPVVKARGSTRAVVSGEPIWPVTVTSDESHGRPALPRLCRPSAA